MVVLLALGAVVFAVVVLLVVMRYRARRRHADAVAAARRVDPTDPRALAAVPLDALDELSRSMVVEVDNAVRTSSNELEVAIDEFGAERTAPFRQAVDKAKAALAQAFSVRQQLDDRVPETPAQRRDLLTRVIVSAAQADRELESQAQAFEQLRDLVINAESRLDLLTQQYIELTTRISPTEQRMSDLHREFGSATIASISGNIGAAKAAAIRRPQHHRSQGTGRPGGEWTAEPFGGWGAGCRIGAGPGPRPARRGGQRRG